MRSDIVLQINGEARQVFVRHADHLLGVLRERLGLFGAKPGCLNGDCGACTVEVDGYPVKSCLVLAMEMQGRKITTIEGLSNTPIQQAFIDHFAFQCGYCTPGFIMTCHTLIQTVPDADDATIKEWLESNICRCTGYKEIEDAVKAVIAEQSSS